MSGHSKWATIKRQKGTKDIKRGQVFTKLSNAITIAVKQGGNVTDPEGNFKLRMAVDAARRANMPKENIERAISRAAGKQASDFEEIIYEGFGPGGFCVIVETLTDKKQRTVAEVKNVFDRHGGTMGSQGSVMYQFERHGVITIDKGDKLIDDIFLIVAEAGAEDVEEEGSEAIVYTKPEDLNKVRSFLIEKGITILNSEFIFKPINLFSISGEREGERAIAFVERLEELNDVQKVSANFDIIEDEMK
jgi:YebC/PmpR family DNA-binding regulatory protein